jgi:hypothetical protein
MDTITKVCDYVIYQDDEESGESVEIHYAVTCEATFRTEHNYGADADGHRGMDITFVDEIAVIEVEPEMPKQLRDHIEENATFLFEGYF